MFDELVAAIDAADQGGAVGPASPLANVGDQAAFEGLQALCCTEMTIRDELVETGPSLIRDDQMMPIMLEACPSFKDHWEAFYEVEAADPTESNDGLPATLPLYLVVHDLARHVAHKMDCGETSELPALFAVVERWITEGSRTVRAVTVSGFLEDLLLPHIFVVSGPKDLLRWVGPRTYKWWVEASGFWDRLAANKVAPDHY